MQDAGCRYPGAHLAQEHHQPEQRPRLPQGHEREQVPACRQGATRLSTELLRGRVRIVRGKVHNWRRTAADTSCGITLGNRGSMAP